MSTFHTIGSSTLVRIYFVNNYGGYRDIQAKSGEQGSTNHIKFTPHPTQPHREEKQIIYIYYSIFIKSLLHIQVKFNPNTNRRCIYLVNRHYFQTFKAIFFVLILIIFIYKTLATSLSVKITPNIDWKNILNVIRKLIASDEIEMYQDHQKRTIDRSRGEWQSARGGGGLYEVGGSHSQGGGRAAAAAGARAAARPPGAASSPARGTRARTPPAHHTRHTSHTARSGPGLQDAHRPYCDSQDITRLTPALLAVSALTCTHRPL